MYPILFSWGDLIIPSWHALFVLAAFMAWWTLGLWRRLAWPEGSVRSLDLLFVIVYVSGYIGARGFSIFIEGESVTRIFVPGSMTLYGGVLCAAFTAIIFAHWKKLSLLRLADLALPSLMLGIAIGRIGCFLNGDDFGKALPDQIDIPMWALKFPNLGDNLARYPVQLAESFICASIASYCWSKRSLLKRRPGLIGTIGIVGYAVTRFILEYYRGDDRGHFLSDAFSPAQVLSIALIVAWTGVLIYSRCVRTLTRIQT